MRLIKRAALRFDRGDLWRRRWHSQRQCREVRRDSRADHWVAFPSPFRVSLGCNSFPAGARIDERPPDAPAAPRWFAGTLFMIAALFSELNSALPTR
jgi:hypothetical protein